jgi:hypothetical protein
LLQYVHQYEASRMRGRQLFICCFYAAPETDSALFPAICDSERFRDWKWWHTGETWGAAQQLISLLFIVSDGDSSCNLRHRTFMAFWEKVYEKFGLNRALSEIQDFWRSLYSWKTTFDSCT